MWCSKSIQSFIFWNFRESLKDERVVFQWIIGCSFYSLYSQIDEMCISVTDSTYTAVCYYYLCTCWLWDGKWLYIRSVFSAYFVSDYSGILYVYSYSQYTWEWYVFLIHVGMICIPMIHGSNVYSQYTWELYVFPIHVGMICIPNTRGNYMYS